MNNDSDAMIVVHFIVKTWIKQEFHAMNKTFSLTSIQKTYMSYIQSGSLCVIKRGKKTSNVS